MWKPNLTDRNMAASTLPIYPPKPSSKTRVIVLSDISNEPDDAESLVRYLTYSNQFDTEGLVAVTSTWLKTKVRPEEMLKIIDAYEKVVGNLNVHVPLDLQYPSAQQLRSVVRSGAQVSVRELSMHLFNTVYFFYAVCLSQNIPLSQHVL